MTASQAQRKWYSKMSTKVSGEDCKLGAVSFIPLFRASFVSHSSANITVQNRMTGKLDEKMQVYVHLGIRLLPKGVVPNVMFNCPSFMSL